MASTLFTRFVVLQLLALLACGATFPRGESIPGLLRTGKASRALVERGLEIRQTSCAVGSFACSDGDGCCDIGSTCVPGGCCPIGSTCSGTANTLPRQQLPLEILVTRSVAKMFVLLEVEQALVRRRPRLSALFSTPASKPTSSAVVGFTSVSSNLVGLSTSSGSKTTAGDDIFTTSSPSATADSSFSRPNSAESGSPAHAILLSVMVAAQVVVFL
ncbi:hypothetical protein DL96DRAFT_1560542 [Flagelloscypha sp. PMI_526]|nr:hypothetical protein DL96DRAFT_1560542 [Flagelloscypha sp. PMI_526]